MEEKYYLLKDIFFAKRGDEVTVKIGYDKAIKLENGKPVIYLENQYQRTEIILDGWISSVKPVDNYLASIKMRWDALDKKMDKLKDRFSACPQSTEAERLSMRAEVVGAFWTAEQLKKLTEDKPMKDAEGNELIDKGKNKLFLCDNHSGSTPGVLGMNWVEAKDKDEAIEILDKILIKRGSKPFAEHPYSVKEVCYINEAKERVSEPFYSGIIRKPKEPRTGYVISHKANGIFTGQVDFNTSVPKECIDNGCECFFVREVL